MRICIQINGPRKFYGIDGSYALIKEAGFDAVDVDFESIVTKDRIKNMSVPEFWLEKGDNFDRRFFAEYLNASKKYHLDNFQAHSPFPSLLWGVDGYFNDGLIEMHRKMIAACDYIGCRNLVIHPFFHSFEHMMDQDEELKVNIDRYSRLIPTARKYGVNILLENMFSRFGGIPYEAFSSDMDTACSCIDTLNNIAGANIFGFCLDTGHLHLLGKDQYRAIVRLGKRIYAFHVHDNDGIHDQHVAPYMGTIQWDRFIAGLKEIGFNGTLDFETQNIWKTMDPEIARQMMKVIAYTGRMFARRAGLDEE